jgi:hypothetical protein
MKYLKELVGKKVQIYPGDSNKKEGILLEINEMGYVFKITLNINNISYIDV